VIIALILGAALAGCSAGHMTQTGADIPTVDGTSGRVGPIVVANVRFAYPQGGAYLIGANAPLLLTIANDGTASDRLISASSAIGSPVISGRTDIPAGYSITAQPHSIAPSLPGSAPDGSPAGPPQASSSSSATSRRLSVGTVHIVVTNLTAPIKPGLAYPVTLVFANAGAITLGVPLGSVNDIP
jgi:hypothetical protein